MIMNMNGNNCRLIATNALFNYIDMNKNNTIYNKKSELDQFYTNPEIAKICYNKLCKTYDVNDFEMILEPSAGTGSFYNILPVDKRKGLDLDPKCNEIEKIDFFNYNPNPNIKTITIGNPPFGRMASLAMKFFNKAATFSDVIAFIIPKTFKKQSLQNKLNLNFHLVSSEDLPKNSFIFNNDQYDVPCCFQIWEYRDVPREKKVFSVENNVFNFVSKNDADFAVRRVGGRTGKCQKDLNKAAEVSHYFLKLKSDTFKIQDIISLIDNLDLSEIINSTAGVKSLSKPEFVEVFLKSYSNVI